MFHVLAHVPMRSRAAASVYDPTYVRFVERELGPASARELGSDVPILASLLTTHDSLASAQMLAWLFQSTEQALACAHCELGQLRADQIHQPALLKTLLRQHPATELLWAAVLLEANPFSRLPPVDLDPRIIDQQLAPLVELAPMLAQCCVAFVRSLRLRGRVREREVWVGVPAQSYSLSVEHVVWQACHEAVVLEVQARGCSMGLQLTHTQTEHAAVVTLHQRAQAGFQSAHARWFAYLGPHRPAVQPDRLDPISARVVDDLLRHHVK